MTTPAQQIKGLERAIRELDQQINQREAELVDQQSALHDGELDDPEIVALYGMRKQFQADLDRLKDRLK